MLTRIEIDGFKTFRDFTLDLPPFLVILGRNASGKSNFFDAIQFLRLAADGTLLEAAQQMRGDVAELFHRRSDGSRVNRITFAVEVLLPATVTDAFGDTVSVRHSRLRYELTVELRPTSRGGERLYVSSESALLIRQADDVWMRRFPARLRPAITRYSAKRNHPLETKTEANRIYFSLSQDGNQGRPRQVPAADATATVLSSLSTAQEFPLLYALKRELQSWRLMQLDPAALRAPSSYDDLDVLALNGGRLANMLRRLADDTATVDRPLGVVADVSADLAGVIPGVRGLRVIEDDLRRQRHLEVQMRDEAPFSARVASDGTLRAIALLAALYDPKDSGLICFEEPENGLFPRRLAEFLGHLRSLVDAQWSGRSTDDVDPLPQLLFSSHSPAVLRALNPVRNRRLRDDVIFIDTVSRVGPDQPKSRVSRVRWIDVTGQPALDRDDVTEETGAAVAIGDLVSPAEIAEFEVMDGLGA